MNIESTRNAEVIEIWKATVDVQKHFNDLCLKIRSLAMTAIAAFVAAIGFSVKEDLTIISDAYPFSACLACAGVLVTFCFFFMDKYWYHKLLMGSVLYGDQIETRFPEIFKMSDNVNGLGLGKSITHESPVRICNIKIHSSGKFWIFYLLPIFVFVALAIALLWSH